MDAKQSVLRVKRYPEYDWKVKKHHERDVTVPRDLKAIAKRDGIDPKRAKLHSFRRTGATWLLQKGMPLADVMALGGWRDLASVQRYCCLLSHDRLQAVVEKAWA